MNRVFIEDAFPGATGVGADNALFAHMPFDRLVRKSVGVDLGVDLICTLATALRT